MDPQVQNMMKSIHKLGLVNYVKHFDDENGFMWTSDSRTYDIGNDVLSDGHSGASFACCLRECQYFLKNPNEIPSEKNDDVHHNEPDTISVSVIQNEVNHTVQELAPELAPEQELAPELAYESPFSPPNPPENEHSCTASLKGSGSEYMFYESMDQNNKNAVDVMASQGMDKAVEFMTKGMTNGTMSYGEMRHMFG